ncbi:MAG: YhgE/Pip family protein [Eggerthellaceae bacterium]|jgi:putative membrane protein
MRNIWLIFKGDMKRVTSNIIGIICLMGLAIIPTLYAWFNIAASWDPYGDTDDLKVAVVNNDDGYSGDLLPVKLNIGDMVVSSLRGNDQFDWQFVDQDEAVEGVKSGEYYASIVIPDNFTDEMMTLFSDDQHQAKIAYYTNEKENPVAPRITDAGASTIQNSISEEFTETVDDVALGALSDVLSYLESDRVSEAGSTVTRNLTSTATRLDNAAGQVRGYASLLGASSSLISSTTTILDAVDSSNASTNRSLDSVKKSLSTAEGSVEGVGTLANKVLKESTKSFDSLQSQTDTALDSAESSSAETADSLKDAASEAREKASSYRSMASAVGALIGQDSSSVSSLKAVASDLDSLAETLDSTASDISDGKAAAQSAKDRIDRKIAAAQASASAAQKSYERKVLKRLQKVSGSLDQVQASSSSLSGKLDAAISSLSTASGSLTDEMTAAEKSLRSAARDLDDSADSLRSASAKLKSALSSGDLKDIEKILGSDTSSLADYLASPVQLKRHAVYGIANYGSSMAPFYSCLSLWVAAVIFVVIMRPELSEARRRELPNLKPHQEYLGRMGIFWLLSLAQSTLLCLGDLYFMGIQCVHPFLFLVAGWVIGIAFTVIVYTLTLSFGNVGKAISVILLVMQVAGSGGIFPIQMEGQIFQDVYPFLPFAYAMRAMQSCVAGIFGNEFVVSLLILVAFTIPFWLLGLLLRNPTIKLNRWVKRKTEETKFM